MHLHVHINRKHPAQARRRQDGEALKASRGHNHAAWRSIARRARVRMGTRVLCLSAPAFHLSPLALCVCVLCAVCHLLAVAAGLLLPARVRLVSAPPNQQSSWTGEAQPVPPSLAHARCMIGEVAHGLILTMETAGGGGAAALRPAGRAR